jgi:pSer/pThr/pTyr-binding forkhead associated (FHA) protein
MAETGGVCHAGVIMPRRLICIEGADQGRTFWLPEAGTLLIGSSHRHADIALNDMWVKRTHCHVKVDGDLVFLTRVESHETLVNKVSITETTLTLGDVIRIGNSQLRYEMAEQAEPAADEPVAIGELLPDEPEFEIVEEADGPEFPRKVPIEELAQHRFNHYQIEAALGQGQSGVVFRALDLKTRQHVALKLLTPDFPQGEPEMQQFIRAVKTGLKLKHPNLISYLGAGRTGQYCWIAMEYVEGETVAEVIERISDGRKIRWKRALHVGLDLSAALEYLAKQQIVHGNITPLNIIIQKPERTARLGDVLLRSALESSKVAAAILKKKALATLPYRAPEQLDPDHKPDALTDLYALGAVLYALLTGHPPFHGQSASEIEAAIRDSHPERPSHAQRGIPPRMQAIVLRLLAKRPGDRVRDASELCEELEAIAEAHDEPE